MKSQITIALAGNPNSGKTTLFNTLTGARQHVGNYPGVTVEKKEGYHVHDGRQIKIVDLPGTYSLTAYSIEEVVARDYLANEKPDVIINIVDASNLERNLYLTCQFLELGVPMVIALNMMDVAEDRGMSIDAAKLSQLLNISVVPLVARSGKGIHDLLQAALARVGTGGATSETIAISYGEDLDRVLLSMKEKIVGAGFMADKLPATWVALKYLENDAKIMEKGRVADSKLAAELEKEAQGVTEHLQKTMDAYPEGVIADHRYGYIRALLRQNVISHRYDADRLHTSDKIDKVLTQRFVGPLVMFAILLGLYKFTFTYSELPVSWLEGLFGLLSDFIDTTLPDGLLKSMFISGIIDGVGGVLGFVPLIMFMFFGIAILEDSGYLARVAFMMDRVFRTFGLHGSSVMAYIVSGGIAGGCAVPGVMATRTLKSPKERMATMLTAPFMSCGAKLPVLALLIGIFFSKNQAMFMFLFTLLAWIMALLVAKLLRSTVLQGESTPFVMELPPYRFPTFKGLAIHTWERTWQYIKKAGTIILGVSILLWAMMTFPGLSEQEEAAFEQKRQTVMGQYPEVLREEAVVGGEAMLAAAGEFKGALLAVDAARAEYALRRSFAGRIGTSLESVSWLAGFDWRTNIALVGGFAAKEVVVSTLGTAYSLGEVDVDETDSLAKTLAKDPGLNPVTALALIVFIMFYSPCFVTVVCISREAGSWKWGAFSMAFNTGFAFLLAVLVYQTGMAFGLGG